MQEILDPAAPSPASTLAPDVAGSFMFSGVSVHLILWQQYLKNTLRELLQICSNVHLESRMDWLECHIFVLAFAFFIMFLGPKATLKSGKTLKKVVELKKSLLKYYILLHGY